MTRARVLVVEDHEDNRDLLQQILEDRYDLEFAEDGAVALRVMGEGTFDAVLLDISLPKIDGLEVVRRLRRDRSDLPPIIAVTAHAMIGDRERIIGAGCDACLTKPIDEDQLIRELESRLPRELR